MGRGGRNRILAIALVLALLAGAGALLALPRGATAQDAETRTLSLDEGWNLAGWTGPDTPLADAITDLVPVIVTAAAFDTAQEAFRTWNATAPPFLNSLDTLRQGQAVWVLVTAPISWVQPVVADPAPLALHSGFNLVTWMGPSGLDPTETFGAIAAALDVAFAFDKPAETFTSFGPARPAFLNSLAPLRYGDGFWVRMDAPATWTQPAPSPPAQVTSPDTSATLEIPRGALPQGVDPAAITISERSDGPVPVLDGGGLPLIALQLEPSGLTFPAPVFLSAPIALGAGEMPIPVLLSQERGVEFVPGATIDSGHDELGRVIVNVPIDHFSWATIFAGAPAMVDVEPIPAGEIPVGAQFDAAAIFTRLDFEFDLTVAAPADFGLTSPERNVAKLIVRIRPLSMRVNWFLNFHPFAVQIGSVRRLETDFGHGLSAPVEQRTLTISERWLCEAPPGPFSLRVQGDASHLVNLRIIEFAENGAILTDETFTDRLIHQELPIALIAGACVAPPGSMAFNSDSGQFSEVILIGTGMEVLVADPTTTLANLDRLPITVVVLVNGIVQQTVVIDRDPADVCINDNVCSTHMDAIDAEPGDTVVITATDAGGDVVAHQSLTVS